MKRSYLPLFFSLVSFLLNAQSGPFNFASTPKAGEGSKTVTNVNAFTGKIGASIPIYAYKGAASPLSMSVSIDYAGGGINLFQNPSCVGTGWNLNAGGGIYRKINGLPDDLYRFTPGNYNVSGFFYTPNVPDNPCCLTYRLPGYYDNPDNKTGQDSEADAWQFSFLGKQGTIVIPKNSSLDGGTNKIYTIPQTNWDFTLSTTGTPANVKTEISQIVITDDNGIRYWFDGIETEQLKTTRTIEDGNTGNPNVFPGKKHHYEYDYKNEYYITSWKLTRIDDLNSNDEITFEYEDYYVSQLSPVTRMEYSYSNRNRFDTYMDDRNYSKGYQKRIKSINFKNGDIVRFNYSAQYRCDFTSEKALTEIAIENSLGKSTVFRPEYVYYQGTNTIPFQSCPYIESESLSKWLFLKAFSRVEGNDVLKMNEFEYIISSDRTTNINENKLPVRKLLGYHDFWGFYNGGDNNNSCPGATPSIDVTSYCQQPNSAFAEIGSLKKIISPNGGYTAFQYEGNNWWLDGAGGDVGGIRIKRITESDGISTANDAVKEYVYETEDGHSSGFAMTLPARKYYNEMSNQSSGGTDQIWAYSTSPNSAIFSIQGSPVGYRRIEERSSVGKTITDYTSFVDNLPITTTCPYPFPDRQMVGEWFYGLPIKQTIKDNSNNTLKTVENFYNYGYEVLNQPQYKSMKSAYLKEADGLVFNSSNDPVACANTASAWRFTTEQYYPVTGRAELTQTIDKTYLNDGRVLTNIANYEYDQQKYTLKKVSSHTSKGAMVEKIMFYPYEYASTSSVYPLVQRSNIASPVSTISILTKASGDKFITGFDKSVYQQLPDYSVRPLTTHSTKATAPIPISSTKTTFTPEENYGDATNQLTEDNRYDQFDEDGNLLQTTAKYISQSAIWDKQIKTVIAKADAPFTDIAFTSFETNEKGNWNYNRSESYLLTAPAGKKVLSLTGNNITTVNGLDVDKKYIVTYWSNSGAYTVNSTNPFQSGRLLNGWTYYKHRVTSATSITISGSGLIDEVRLYPENARMSSVTYVPLLGVTSESSADGEVTKYEYDAFGRLLYIRGSDGNIKKVYCYSSNGSISPCGNTAPYQNVATTETLYAQCGPGYASGSYDYTVPAGRYMSFISQEDANNQAKADIKTFGQSQANANVSCVQTTIYARISYENIVYQYGAANGDVVVRFYSDAAGSQPVSISNVSVNFDKYTSCSYGSSPPDDGPQPSVSGSGQFILLVSGAALHFESVWADPDGDHPMSCDVNYNLTNSPYYNIIL